MERLDKVIGGVTALSTVLSFRQDPVACGRRLASRHGRALGLSLPFAAKGRPPFALFIASEEGNRAIFESLDDLRPTGLWPVRAPKRTIQERMRFNYLCTAGDRYRHYASQIGRPLKRSAVERRQGELAAIVAREIRQWRHGETLDLSFFCKQLAIVSVFEMLLGEKDRDRAIALGERLDRYHGMNWEPAAMFLRLGMPGTAYYRVLRMAEAVRAEIDDWAGATAHPCPVTGRSIRGEILGMRAPGGGLETEDFRIASLATVAWAAFDTPWLALFWCLVLLSRHPDVAQALRETLAPLGPPEEIPVRQLSRVALLDGVILEAMRLLPPAPFLGLRTVAATRIGDVKLGRGCTIFLSAFETHRDPSLYADPDSFLPSRWNGRPPNANTFLAFSGGERRCPGYVFSMQFLRTVLAVLLARGQVELPEETEIGYLARPTLIPDRPVQARLVEHARPARLTGPIGALLKG